MQAVLFDLYETLITEYVPDRRPGVGAERLGLSEEFFDREWKARRDRRMRGEIPDYHSVVREICTTGGVAPNERVIEEIYQERLRTSPMGFAKLALRFLGWLPLSWMPVMLSLSLVTLPTKRWPHGPRVH